MSPSPCWPNYQVSRFYEKYFLLILEAILLFMFWYQEKYTFSSAVNVEIMSFSCLK